MARYRRKPIPVEAVQLRWDQWAEMCEHVGVGRFEEGKPQGCYVDAEGRVTDDSNARMGLKIPTGGATKIAAQDDWVVRMPDGELEVFKPVVFETLFESHADYKVEFKPDWRKYPKLVHALEMSRGVDCRADLGALLIDARADAAQYVHDVRAEELAAARADERAKIAASIDDDTADLIRFAREVFTDRSRDLSPVIGSLADRLERRRLR